MKQARLSLLLCSILAGTAHAATESGSVEAGKRVIPNLFANKATAVESKPETVAPVTQPKTAPVSKPLAVTEPVVTAKTTIKTKHAKKPTKATAKPVIVDKAQAPVNTVKAWAAAWSAKDTDKYLAFYAPDFHTPEGVSRSDWEAQRRERITKPAHIQVQARKIKVDFADDAHVTVKFHQNYHASHIKSADNKTLLMVKSGETWLIQEERKN
jgi:ketosteroid isomerase-like protein